MVAACFSRHQPHSIRHRLVFSPPSLSHLRSTPTISPLHRFAHSHNLPQPICQLMHSVQWLLKPLCDCANRCKIALCVAGMLQTGGCNHDKTRNTSPRAVQKGIASSTPLNVRQSRAANMQIVCVSLKDSSDTLLLDACRTTCMALLTHRFISSSHSG